MNKTIREWIAYYAERYGDAYRIRIEDPGVSCEVYYWWNEIPKDMFTRIPKRVWSHSYNDEYGIKRRELEFML